MRTQLKRFVEGEYWLSVFGVLALYIFGIVPRINANNAGYALEQIHQYDNTLFVNNLSGSIGNGMSARFFMNILVAFLMKFTKGQWIPVCVFLEYFGAVVLALATVEIVFNLTEKNRLFLCSLLAFLIWSSVNSDFVGWSTFELHTSIGMATAYTFVVLALSQVIGIKKNWNAAWTWMIIATMLHIHEGMWGFCLLFIIYATECFYKDTIQVGKQQRVFVIFVIVMAISVIPGFSGNDIGLSAQEFIDIYAKTRVPQHLDPACWGINSILKYGFVIVGGILLRIVTLINTKRDHLKFYLFESILTLIAWIIGIVVEYICIDVVPVVFIATMYIPKFFKYVGLLSLIWCIEDIINWVDEEEYIFGGMCLVTVIAASSDDYIRTVIIYALSISLLCICIKCNKKMVKVLYPIIMLGTILVWFSLGKKMYVLVFGIVLFMAVWNKKAWMKRFLLNPITIVLLSSLALIGASKDRFWNVDNGNFRWVNPDEFVIASMDQETFDLAKKFEAMSLPSDIFLYDPNDKQDYWFQLVSKRNCYVSYKLLPANASVVKEWNERVQETENLFEKNISEITSIMRNAEIGYILVNNVNYERFGDSDDYELFLASGYDNYRIYKLR